MSQDEMQRARAIGQRLAQLAAPQGSAAARRREAKAATERVVGSCRRYPARIRAVLLRLAEGHSERVACAIGGISMWRWRELLRDYPGLSIDAAEMRELGLAHSIEYELVRRALSGEADRGSIQALLALARSRMPEMREEAMVRLDISSRAAAAVRAITSGWQASGALVEGSVIEGSVEEGVEGSGDAT